MGVRCGSCGRVIPHATHLTNQNIIIDKHYKSGNEYSDQTNEQCLGGNWVINDDSNNKPTSKRLEETHKWVPTTPIRKKWLKLVEVTPHTKHI